MAIGETVITIVGNLTADPELRTTGQGAQVASFTIANTPRNFNKQTGQYEDGSTLFMRCSAWNDFGQHCARSLVQGHARHRPRQTPAALVSGAGRHRTAPSWSCRSTSSAHRSGTRRRRSHRISRQDGPVYGNPASPQPTTVNTGAGGWSQQPQQTATDPRNRAPPADDPWSAPTDGQSSFGEFGKAGSASRTFKDKEHQ